MNILDIIIKKRDGLELTNSEVEFFVREYMNNNIADYQASALLMAIFLMGFSDEEIGALTFAMLNSGKRLDLSDIRGIKVDKHSTGGVGDKTTFTVLPIAAACGVKIAKMSGRGLGFTGGTIDKLESIPGFRTSLNEKVFKKQISDIDFAITSQTEDIAVADKKLYSLRDVTGTVESLGLIASSIMSKKLALGSDAIVLDVKVGEGAFMHELSDAEKLAKLMCSLGEREGKNTVALLTGMDEPLGFSVGNSIEVIEAIEFLKGRDIPDLHEISIAVSGMMIFAGGMAKSFEEGKEKATDALESGKAIRKLEELFERQGADTEIINDTSKFKKARLKYEVKSDTAGFITKLSAMKIGEASQRSGAGRLRKEDEIDHSAGILLRKKVGDMVTEGEVLADVFSNDETKLEEASILCKRAFKIGTEPKGKTSKIIEIING